MAISLTKPRQRIGMNTTTCSPVGEKNVGRLKLGRILTLPPERRSPARRLCTNPNKKRRAGGRRWANLDTTTNIRGSAKRNAAFTLQHGAMLTPRQPEGCVPVVVSRCAPGAAAPEVAAGILPAVEPGFQPGGTKAQHAANHRELTSA